MRLTVIGFLALQIILWSIVFSDDSQRFGSDNYKAIADTWHVVEGDISEIGDSSDEVFYQLILNEDGTFKRESQHGYSVGGEWKLDEQQNALVLKYSNSEEKFRIIQLPESEHDQLVLQKEEDNDFLKNGPEYTLTRL